MTPEQIKAEWRDSLADNERDAADPIELVRRFPLTAIGIALISGIVIGACPGLRRAALAGLLAIWRAGNVPDS